MCTKSCLMCHCNACSDASLLLPNRRRRIVRAIIEWLSITAPRGQMCTASKTARLVHTGCIAFAEACARFCDPVCEKRSEEHTSELQSLMRISYAVFCLTKKNTIVY